MPRKSPPHLTIAERIANGTFGVKRKPFGAPNDDNAHRSDLYAAHARTLAKREKREQASEEDDRPTWEAIETQRAEEGQLPLDKRSR